MVSIDRGIKLIERDNMMNRKTFPDMFSARNTDSVLFFNQQPARDMPTTSAFSFDSTSPVRRIWSGLILFPELIAALSRTINGSCSLRAGFPWLSIKRDPALNTGERTWFNKLRMFVSRWMFNLAQLEFPCSIARMQNVHSPDTAHTVTMRRTKLPFSVVNLPLGKLAHLATLSAFSFYSCNFSAHSNNLHRRCPCVNRLFLGGGTTALVSLAMGRKFVGCDIDPGCVAKTKKRVEAQASCQK